MRDHCLERARPARLRMDADPIGHCVSLLLDQHPWRIAGEAMTGVVPSRFSERKLLCDPVEGVPAVTNSIRPRDQILPPTSRAHLIDAEPAYHISPIYREGAQRGAHLRDDGAIGARDDLVLIPGRRRTHELALYR